MTNLEITDFLDSKQLRYLRVQHSPAYTANEIAEAAHIQGKQLAKTVMVKGGERLYMIVIPSNYHLLLDVLEKEIGLGTLTLSSESEFASLFPKCEVGAIPPIGTLYGVDVIIAEVLTHYDNITFSAGTHDTLIQMNYKEYEKLANPKVFAMTDSISAQTAPRISRKPKHFFH